MGIIRITALLLSLLLVLSGCSLQSRVELDYADTAFECEVSWQTDGTVYRAHLSVSAPAESGRDISVSFYEPSALCGVTAKRISGKTTLSLGNIEIPLETSGLLEIAELFETDGEIVSSSLVQSGEEKLNLITLEQSDGERLEIYLSRDGVPKRIDQISGGAISELYVLWFEKKQE